MQISTNEFLLGSLNDMLAQQANVNQLNREIATGQTMLDAASNPAGASEAMADANAIGEFAYDQGNAAAASASLQNGISALQQVTTVLDQLNQTAVQAASATASSDRQPLAATAQEALQQLLELANTQDSAGNYVFAGSQAKTAAFSALPDGQIVFNGDAGANVVDIAPSLAVPSSISGAGIFTGIPAGDNGIDVTAANTNTGTAYAVPQGVTDPSEFSAAQLAGTQYRISFAAGSGGSLTYTVTSGAGAPGSAKFSAASGIVASGSFTAGGGIAFDGIDIAFNGTPAAGDNFDVDPDATTSMFQIVQSLVSALQAAPTSAAASAQVQQQIENVIAALGNAQTSSLSAQASLGATLSEVTAVQGQDASASSNAQIDLGNLQSANLPQVMANYSESLTALEAAQLAFAKVQGLTLFNYIQA